MAGLDASSIGGLLLRSGDRRSPDRLGSTPASQQTHDFRHPCRGVPEDRMISSRYSYPGTERSGRRPRR